MSMAPTLTFLTPLAALRHMKVNSSEVPCNRRWSDNEAGPWSEGLALTMARRTLRDREHSALPFKTVQKQDVSVVSQ
jgi:hypothetical protein